MPIHARLYALALVVASICALVIHSGQAATMCEQRLTFLGKTGGATPVFWIAEDVGGECQYSGLILLTVSGSGVSAASAGLNYEDWGWLASGMAHLHTEAPIELQNDDGSWRADGAPWVVAAPPQDASLDKEFGDHVSRGGDNAHTWQQARGADEIQPPRLSSARADVLYARPGGLYFNYTIARAYYFPRSEYLLVFTDQQIQAVGGDSMHGFLLIREDVLARIPSAASFAAAHGPEALVALRQALGEPDRWLRNRAVAVLTEAGEAAAPALSEALRDQNARVRVRAAEALTALGGAARRAVPELIAALRDRERDMRLDSIKALSAIGADADSAVPALIEALEGGEAELRQGAAYALGRIGTRPDDAVPALLAVLGDAERGVAREAVAALRVFGEPTRAALPAFLVSAKELPPSTRARIIAQIGALRELAVGCAPIIAEMARDEHPDVRREARMALRRLGDVRVRDQ